MKQLPTTGNNGGMRMSWQSETLSLMGSNQYGMTHKLWQTKVKSIESFKQVKISKLKIKI